jgi:hypothetical protein
MLKISAVGLGCAIAICGTAEIAMANTPRGDLGSFGSENFGSFMPDSSGNNAVVSAIARKANQGSSKALAVISSLQSQSQPSTTVAWSGGTVTITVIPPTLASTQAVRTAGTTTFAIAMQPNDGTQPTQRSIKVANVQTARQLSMLLAGVLEGLKAAEVSPTMMQSATALVADLGTVPIAEAIMPEKLAVPLVKTLAMLDQLPAVDAIDLARQLNQPETRSLLDATLKSYNQTVQVASDDVVVMLAQSPTFQRVETQLRGLSSAAQLKR